MTNDQMERRLSAALDKTALPLYRAERNGSPYEKEE